MDVVFFPLALWLIAGVPWGAWWASGPRWGSASAFTRTWVAMGVTGIFGAAILLLIGLMVLAGPDFPLPSTLLEWLFGSRVVIATIGVAAFAVRASRRDARRLVRRALATGLALAGLWVANVALYVLAGRATQGLSVPLGIVMMICANVPATTLVLWLLLRSAPPDGEAGPLASQRNPSSVP